jgi:hypothetical protein
MENVILSCEQIRNLEMGGSWDLRVPECVDRHSPAYLEDNICKTQARHLLRILKEPCTEHDKTAGRRLRPRYLCPECMKQIEKEIEG